MQKGYILSINLNHSYNQNHCEPSFSKMKKEARNNSKLYSIHYCE